MLCDSKKRIAYTFPNYKERRNLTCRYYLKTIIRKLIEKLLSGVSVLSKILRCKISFMFL